MFSTDFNGSMHTMNYYCMTHASGFFIDFSRTDAMGGLSQTLYRTPTFNAGPSTHLRARRSGLVLAV